MPRVYVKRLGSRSYGNYSSEWLQNCLDAIKSGMSKSVASKTYGIPLRTLTNKIKGLHYKKPGGQNLFSQEEELSFVKHILKLSEFGFPITSEDLRYVVAAYLKKKGTIISKFNNNIPGREWVNLFIKRHSVLSKRFASNIKTSRVNMTKQDIVEYVENLRLSVDGVPPSNIWNFDETNLSDDPKSKKVLVKRGVKYPERICNFTKSSFSVMFCVNAAGGFVPPYVIYKAEHLWSSWFEGGPSGCRYNRTKHGWFDSNTFEDWFVSHMLPTLKKQDGVKVLIGDNLSSHINTNVIDLCEAHNIRFVCLPPNSTHLTQPLDVSVFSSLKNEWRKLLSDWRDTSEGLKFQTLPKDVFASLLNQLMVRMKPKFKDIVPPGFRKCSIYPIDADQILSRIPPSSLDTSTTSLESLSIDIGDAFIQHLERRRGEVITKPRNQRKKLNVPPGKSICPKDLGQSSSDEFSSVDSPSVMTAETFSEVQCVQEQEPEDVPSCSTAPASSVTKYRVGDYVIVTYNEKQFPGQVINILPSGLLVKCMEKGKKAWKWPAKEDTLVYEWTDIIKKIDIRETKRGFFYITEMDSFVYQ